MVVPLALVGPNVRLNHGGSRLREPPSAASHVRPILLTVALNKVDLIRFAPLAQGSLRGLGFECVPLLKTPFRRQKFFETRVSSSAPEEGLDVRIPVWQLLFDKPKRQIVA